MLYSNFCPLELLSCSQEIDEKIVNLLYNLLKDVLIDFFKLYFQFLLKSTVFELEICSLHQNRIEFVYFPIKLIYYHSEIWAENGFLLILCTGRWGNPFIYGRGGGLKAPSPLFSMKQRPETIYFLCCG